MSYADLSDPLRQWIDQCLTAGTSDEGVTTALQSAGYAQEQITLVRTALGERRLVLAAQAKAERFAAQASKAAGSQDLPVSRATDAGVVVQAAPVTGTDSSDLLARLPNALHSSDRKVHLLFALNAPRVVLFGDLLDASECDALVEASRGKLERSTVLNPATGERDVGMERTSSGTYFRRGEHPLVTTIEQRIAELTGHPVEHGEPLQILHYLPGAEYKPHYDWFDPAQAGNQAVLAQGGQRVATVVMYLNDVESGGSTVFPQVGLDVLPRKGNAVFFAYKNPGEAPDPRSLHGGTPVAAGEKWIATKWIRERAYPG